MVKKDSQKEILVYADWEFLGGNCLMGVLYADLLKGKEIFSFEYDEKWLSSGKAQIIDPDLQLYSGRQYQSADDIKNNFGIFLDSSPDRWGRLLMRRREAAIARIEKRAEQTLLETDYLLGVYDEHRMGALRFKQASGGPFLNNNKDMATPPWTSIRELEQISLMLETDEAEDNPDYLKWLNKLIAPGSSIGGARPKADVLAPDKTLWIAKFPSKNDDSDVGAWEMIANKLAEKAGINAAIGMTKKFSAKFHTFLSKRFDRITAANRIHFASAMTLLGYKDGYDFSEGTSYLELAQYISNNSARVKEDLEELWRRIVFNICISNTDDHLRNHGFILTPKGWVLSPAYDLNPNETGIGLSLNITMTDNSLNLDLAMDVREYFRLDEKKALEIIARVKASASNWRAVASKYQVPKSEQEMKARAFSRIN